MDGDFPASLFLTPLVLAVLHALRFFRSFPFPRSETRYEDQHQQDS